jgi:LPXTG-motif cell wall-anchored protein
MNARTGWMRVLMILAVGAIGLAFTARMSAQVQTATDTTAGASTHEVKVVNATVVAVSGNDVVVKMEDGSLRHIANVPDSARAMVDGKEVGVHDLVPGMKLQKTITTTTTPKVITTTKTVTGKVWHVNPPLSVILTMDDGTNQEFKIPKGQKFTVNGQSVDAFGLKKGMIVNATKVVEEPITVVQQQAKLTGSMPPPPPPPAPDQPILVAVITPAAAPAPAEAAPAALPKTGSELPLTGLLGFLSLAGSAGVRLFRKVSR